jgi:hypothetical protein
MILCSVCGKVADEDHGYETCSKECREVFDRQEPYIRNPPHSQPRQIEERPSTPGLDVPRSDAA